MSLGGGDLQVILRRIRHGFIVCDDSELCDKIIGQEIENNQRRKNLAKSKSIDIEKTDLLTLLRTEPDFIRDELSHSPEWTATNVQDRTNKSSHLRRVRCETLGRLDEIKTENEAKRKVKIISWQDPNSAQINTKSPDESAHFDNDGDDSTSSLFQRRTEPILPLVKQSPLTALIQSTVNKQNPFAHYSQFDGTPNISSNQSKKFTVHFQSQKQKLLVVVSSHATVTETIGFACYKYTAENREPALTQKDPSKYFLYIGDDDGEAEEDFPPLTHERPIGQYAFPHLILIEQVNQASTSVKPDSDNSQIDEYDEDDDDEGSFDDSSRSITPTSSEHQKSSSSMEKISSNIATEDIQTVNDPIDDLNRLYESLNQKSYIFDYYLKLGGSKHVKVRIDVSGEQIRFDVLEKSNRSILPNILLTTQRLVDCNLLSKDKNKKRDRTRVHLTFESQQVSDGPNIYQTHELESTIEIAEQFRDQILSIIKLRNPQGREIYEQQHQQQQQQQRDSSKKRRFILNLFGAANVGGGSSAKS